MVDIFNSGSPLGQAPPPPPPALVPFKQIDWDAAYKHQTLLDPAAKQVLFGSSDDNKERKKLRNDYLKPFARELRDIKGDLTPEARARKNAIYRDAPGHANQHYLGSIVDPATRQWIEYWQAQGCGIFITLQEMHGDRRGIVETTRIRTIFGDMDGGQSKPWPLSPSFIVETGPGKEHPYWLVSDYVPKTDETAATFTGIEQRIVDDHGADNGAKDLARVLRLAGTWHLKGTPRQVQIKAPQGAPTAYSWAQLCQAFPPVLRQSKAPRPPRAARPAGMPPAPGELPDDYQVTMLKLGEAMAFVDMESRADWIAAGMALHDYTHGCDDGLALWIANSDPDAEAECIAQWQTFTAGRSGNVTIASLFKSAYDGRWDGGSALLPIFDIDPREFATVRIPGATPFAWASPPDGTRQYDPKRPGHKATVEAYVARWGLAGTVEGAPGSSYPPPEMPPPPGGAVSAALPGFLPTPTPSNPWLEEIASRLQRTIRAGRDMPRRPFLYGQDYIRRETSALYAPGGGGKTALAAVEMLAIATGRSLLGVAPKKPLKVLFFGEDGIEEIERRLRAACDHYGLDWDRDVAGRIAYGSLRNMPLLFAVEGPRGGFVVNTPHVEAVKKLIRAEGADVVYFDTMKKIHAVSENDSGAMDALVGQLNMIAEECNCANMVLAHTRKQTGYGERTIEDARGARSQLDALRSARMLVRMTKEEAEDLGIDPPKAWRYIRIADSKENMAPPADRAKWLQLASKTLENGDPLAVDDFGLADNVQVVTLWSPQKDTAEISEGQLNEIKQAMCVDHWRQSDQTEYWAGYAIGRAMGIDIGCKADAKEKTAERSKARKILNQLLELGVLETYDRLTENRQMKPFVRVKRELGPDGCILFEA